MTKKTGKRILKVTIKRMFDDSPDTSHLGEYSDKSTSEFSVDRAHSEDCASVSQQAAEAKRTLDHAQQTVGDLQSAVNSETDSEEWEALEESYQLLGRLQDEAVECDCGERGDLERGQYRYFNPSFNYVDKQGKPTDGLTSEDVRKYTRQDYERMEDLNRGGWCYIGIRAEAEIGIGDVADYPKRFDVTTQTISSGGLWGVESDSEDSYFTEIEAEELAQLKTQLLALGFSKRAISTAFKNVERKST